MEQVINSIIEVEKKAQEILNEAIMEKELLPQNIEFDTKELTNYYLKKETLRLEKTKKSEKENYNRKIAQLNKKKDLVISKMISKYNKNCDNWVEILFNKIISR